MPKPKSSKSEANYIDRAPRPGIACRNCTMFIHPRSCTAVAGTISPDGHCSFFKRSIAATLESDGNQS